MPDFSPSRQSLSPQYVPDPQAQGDITDYGHNPASPLLLYYITTPPCPLAAEYQKQCSIAPGTYYLTKGWIESGDTPFSEYDMLVKRYGEQIAQRIINKILKNYTRLAFINTGKNKLEYYREHARSMAGRFNLRYEEIQGSDVIIKKMLYGPWNAEFVIIPPGKTVSFFDFRKNGP